MKRYTLKLYDGDTAWCRHSFQADIEWVHMLCRKKLATYFEQEMGNTDE